MAELKQCPFCGGEATISGDWASDSGEWWAVDCLNSECLVGERSAWEGACVTTGWRKSKEQAIKAWNTRSERMCNAVPSITADMIHTHICSECGGEMYGVMHYCPSCGAKVVN